jgi:hypothetical protein
MEQKANAAGIHPKSLYVLRPLPGLGDENSVSLQKGDGKGIKPSFLILSWIHTQNRVQKSGLFDDKPHKYKQSL